jgi:type VI protein secretion system component VasA
MFNRYFQQELDNLKELGTEFSKAHWKGWLF